MPSRFNDALAVIAELQASSGVQFIRREGELLLLVKQDPGHPVKYYMSKSGMSARWFNEILRQLVACGLVRQEHCTFDARRKLLR